MSNKPHLLVGFISGICVWAHVHVPTILQLPVTLLYTVFCLVQNVFVLGGGHCNILDAAVQNLVARSSGFVHYTSSKEFQAFSHYVKLPLVSSLFVPTGAQWTKIWKNIRFILIYDMCFHSLRLYGDGASVCLFPSATIHTSWGCQSPLSWYKMFMLPPEETASDNFVPPVRIQSHILLRHLFAPLHRWPFKYLLHASSLIIMKLQILGSFRYPWWVKLCRILVHQVSVFGSTAATKVLHLHHLWQDGLIKVVLQCCCREISLIQVIILILQINTRHDVGLYHSSDGYSPACQQRSPDLIPGQSSMPNL